MTALIPACGTGQPERPTILSGVPVISYRIGDEVHESTWRLDPELQPDILFVDLEAGETAEVCFVTDVEEFCRVTTIGEAHDFDVVFDGLTHHTRIEGRRFVPAAVFTEEYIVENTGKITPVIPEVYELVNVAIALTETARENRWLVFKQSEYYARVMNQFADHQDHPFVIVLNEQLEENRARYARLKMNAHAFEYDERGEIQRSSIYDRTGFAGSSDNTLLPFLEQMRAFSRDTSFRAFYELERPTYDEQIRFYAEDVDLNSMKAWLGRQFPEVDAYDSVKIVFSPLVGGSQSVTWFEQGDFRELQPHVNFPYHRLDDVSPESDAIYRGNIVFTELNHGYINPTADGYAGDIVDAVTDLSFWADEGKTASYGSPLAIFNEYMNWGLIALRYLDRAPAEDHEKLLSRLDRYMGEGGRGFLQFPAFRAVLVESYVNRREGETVADLYPVIIRWFADHEASAGGPEQGVSGTSGAQAVPNGASAARTVRATAPAPSPASADSPVRSAAPR
jgi:hypothetical protein